MPKSKEVKFVLPEKRALLSEPENSTIPRLFVAATRQNEGKTTTCLGLIAALQTHFKRVAYIKPIGQRFIDVEGSKIDEDSLLLDSIYNLDAPIEAMSPIAIDATFTRRYINKPEEHRELLVDRICRAFDRTTYFKEAVIIEGSGHAGVGSVFDLSNAAVARILGAKAIIVSSGGIGRPVDEIALNKSLFDKFGVEVIGAIINKVQVDKTEVVREYTARALERLGVPLLGIIPEEKQLSAPNLSQIVEEVEGRWINGREAGQHQRILRIVVGAMTARGMVDYFQPGVLIITPGDRDDVILAALASSGISGQRQCSGLILTSDTLPHPRLMEMLAETKIPVVISNADSYSVAARITAMTVKTQPQDADKIPLIQQLVLNNIDLPRLLKAL
ncbi:MAG: AAA family ATPase [Verrucomicrobiota bacterium]|nr:AAA family ATPase [Verrucomicrobiota bacterium]